MARFRFTSLGCAALLGLVGERSAAAPAPSCPATLAPIRAFAEPSSSSATRFWFGSEALAVLLNRSGVWHGMGPSHNYRDKLFWWRQSYNGATEQRPELIVSGRRLDGEAPPASVSKATNAHHKDFGGWAMLVMVEFPTRDCWGLTVEYRGQTLSFVVQVEP